MLAVHDLEIRVGARLLMEGVTFRVDKGDKIGLVGRNGAGKTTMTKALAGETMPTGGEITRSGEIGYLPQDPRSGNPEDTARKRILDARGLGEIVEGLRAASLDMGSSDPAVAEKAMAKYARLDDRFTALGGYAAEAEAASIASNLALPDRILDQQLKTLSGGQRRRIELARILFSEADTMILDEPTNHLDADSVVWLREYLKTYAGGVIVISHDVELVDEVVNRVFYLDANRQVIDIYNMGWKHYQRQRVADEERRRKERANAEKKAGELQKQAARFGAKATKAAAAHQMVARAEKLLAGLEDVREQDRVAKLRFPTPVACGRTPLMAEGLSKSYGSLEIFAGVDLAIDRGSRVVILGLNGAGKTTLLRILAGADRPDTGEVQPGHGLRIGYYAQEHENIDVNRTVIENMVSASPALTETEARRVLGSFLFTGDDGYKPAGVLSGGEKTRLSLAMIVVSGANVLLLDEPTNNLDPASREEILGALAGYEGAVVLVSHDAGAVEALSPERVLLLPDGVEDHWNKDYAELIELA
ncbi:MULTISPECIES: ABC-F family ATP-binding cassette domain-containing protein [unclassified Curtobacterium]|uniref:ABC-F family ATP-binding cassette domain-containing protein n=1 Tax=unclassified Curtobacterium TaxID=257496 RepID=UPI000DA7CB1B|nr:MULTISPECIES: ABC-F family ATP-binding cassette domain-containing protein [unclassified Curtobacterium]PZE28774.1 ABC transporter ATP-binding protein [Curtobacterium sp. MCBD17_028]PZE77125.1 ABC transporter ATP-binding protein [Curtobacterium sp. MCBD17_019]PZF59195.1 ABC transporter ATP-binding protein [Curtobacterium sp. MCBD17_034]PZM34263.1 ABC transporter ATP-binding protein [Curtobacterium sp. MCBD17_031]WIB62248.1 ABC-F family ATP-binding cassette domain-containing protein [Curtobac